MVKYLARSARNESSLKEMLLLHLELRLSRPLIGLAAIQAIYKALATQEEPEVS